MKKRNGFRPPALRRLLSRLPLFCCCAALSAAAAYAPLPEAFLTVAFEDAVPAGDSSLGGLLAQELAPWSARSALALLAEEPLPAGEETPPAEDPAPEPDVPGPVPEEPADEPAAPEPGPEPEEPAAAEPEPVPEEPPVLEAGQYPIVAQTLTGEGSSSYLTLGDIRLKNHPGYDVDLAAVWADTPDLKPVADGPQVLIVHTHTTESYSPEGMRYYTDESEDRSTDNAMNMVAVGNVFAAQLEAAGIETLHETGLNDYPRYNGSYGRMYDTITWYLQNYPSIRCIIDLHRDALGGTDGNPKYKVVGTIDGRQAAQVMLVMGTDASGLEHPDWRENLALALRYQDLMLSKEPDICRPMSLSTERFNEHFTTGSMLVEIGTAGNTLSEALLTAEFAGKALAELLLEF